ncbi:MAG: toll/interleukin-1 receptor domain-containing protein [Chloroflexota bacterium]
MSEKPVIFISHSSQDGELARLIKRQIELCFDNNVEAFAADINPGEDWFIKVMGKLNAADAIVVLITHYSVNSSHWVWFELGYFWARHDEALKNSEAKRKIYYPIYMKNVEWPNPVKDLQIQAALLNDKSSVRSFFQQLCHQFENGKIGHVQVDEIVEAVNSYPTRFLAPSDPELIRILRERDLEPNHSDQHYKEVLDDFVHKEWLNFAQYAYQYIDRSKHYGWNEAAKIKDLFSNPKIRDDSNLLNIRLTIFAGQLVNYNDLDTELKLPVGTSRRLLKDVALRYLLVPIEAKDLDDCIRFRVETETETR